MYNVMLVLKTGGDFSFRDVELITEKIKQTWKGKEPVNIYCIYDKTSSTIKLKNCTLLPMPYTWKGWWAKMNLFSVDLRPYRPFLYMDLDTAITGDISTLFPEVNTEIIITLSDFYHPGKVASGLMWIPNGENTDHIWKEWIKDPEYNIRNFRGDQDFLRAIINTKLFWQDISNKIINFKPNKRWLVALPRNVAVVCFHGKPRIWEAAKTVNWVNTYING